MLKLKAPLTFEDVCNFSIGTFLVVCSNTIISRKSPHQALHGGVYSHGQAKDGHAGIYRRISQMSYQPKSLDKMVDFETLTVGISLNSIHMFSYLCKALVIGYTLEKIDQNHMIAY